MKKIFLIAFTLITAILFIYTLWYSPNKTTDAPTSIAVNIEERLPLPSLDPQEVVHIQLKAMQENDAPYENHGIETAFHFASPSNKENTGPLHEFISLVQTETYNSLLNFKRYGLDDIEIKGDKALQKVTLINQYDEPVVYYFKLAMQHEAPYEGCWMTEGVVKY